MLPLATAPLFRESATIEIVVKLGDKEECHLKLDCESLRKALDWAAQRQTELAQISADQKCTSPEGGCFITTACCETLGLDDDCFELAALRRYRDQVLAKRPGGEADIARYYELAPLILARMLEPTRRARLLLLYARFILPASLAAHLGFECARLSALSPDGRGARCATSPPNSSPEQQDGRGGCLRARRFPPRPG